jgi:hypothetical protein
VESLSKLGFVLILFNKAELEEKQEKDCKELATFHEVKSS